MATSGDFGLGEGAQQRTAAATSPIPIHRNYCAAPTGSEAYFYAFRDIR